MASPSSIQFIDAALSCGGTLALAYLDPAQKWLIRNHLISLLQDFPSLSPSMGTFTHNDGATVNILNAAGLLHVSNSKPAIPLTVWIHENYPQMPPIVYVSSISSAYAFRRDHPFVDGSGAIASAYLQTWVHPRSNLSDLVRNLVKLFSHTHPFYYDSTGSSSNSHPSLFSKMEAMDRLIFSLHSDMVSLRSKSEKEIEEISLLQAEMISRVDISASIIIGLEHERTNLKRRAMELTEEADVLLNWLKVVHGRKTITVEEADGDVGLEAADEESKLVLELTAADMAVEDSLYALGRAVEHGALACEMYIKQVRILAREQFSYRDKLLNLFS